MIYWEIVIKLCGGLAVVGAFIAGLAALHWTYYIGPRIKKELQPIQDNLSVVARLLKGRYREEYEQAENDISQEQRMRGLSAK